MLRLLVLVAACGTSSPTQPKLQGCDQYAEMQVRCGVDSPDMRRFVIDKCESANDRQDQLTLQQLACAVSTDDCDVYGRCYYGTIQALSAP